MSGARAFGCWSGYARGVPSPVRYAPRRFGMGSVGVALLALVAVVALHGIDPTIAVRAAGPIGSTEFMVGHSHGGTADSAAAHKDLPDEPCHGEEHCLHPQICESGAVASDIELPGLASTFEGFHAARPRSLIDTVAAEAARGSGCGPPSLVDLSISRT